VAGFGNTNVCDHRPKSSSWAQRRISTVPDAPDPSLGSGWPWTRAWPDDA